MLKKTSKKSLRISANELSQFAAEGIQRALETRDAADIELNQEDVEQVSGGFSYMLNPGIIAGGRLSELVLNNGINPANQGMPGMGIQGLGNKLV